MTAPSLLPSLPPERERSGPRARHSSVMTAPSLLPSLPPEGERSSPRARHSSAAVAFV